MPVPRPASIPDLELADPDELAIAVAEERPPRAVSVQPMRIISVGGGAGAAKQRRSQSVPPTVRISSRPPPPRSAPPPPLLAEPEEETEGTTEGTEAIAPQGPSETLPEPAAEVRVAPSVEAPRLPLDVPAPDDVDVEVSPPPPPAEETAEAASTEDDIEIDVSVTDDGIDEAEPEEALAPAQADGDSALEGDAELDAEGARLDAPTEDPGLDLGSAEELDDGDVAPDSGEDGPDEGVSVAGPSPDIVASEHRDTLGDAGDTEERTKKAPPPPPKRKQPPPPAPSERPIAAALEEPKVDTSKKPRVKPWWEELFTDDFGRSFPVLTEAQVKREADFIEESLGVAPGGAILDLACGVGHHAVDLSSRGYAVVGFDLSVLQLAIAGEHAQERAQKMNFLQGDMRDMAFEETFDGVYCWNTSFGYFEEEKNAAVALNVFRALRPGGSFLLDVVNRDFIAEHQPSSVWFEGDACVCMDDMSVDFITSRLRVKRTMMLDDGRNKECSYSIRVYSLHELGKMLHDIGFKVIEASGHPALPGVFFGATSPRVIILAQKPG